jgi:hypothetical protein
MLGKDDGFARSWQEWAGAKRDMRGSLHVDTLTGAAAHATRMVEEWQARLDGVRRALARRGQASHE